MVKNIATHKSTNKLRKTKYIGEGLQLNRSYDIFNIGSKVSLYKNFPHTVERHTEPEEWFCYNFRIQNYEIELWCIKGIVDSICCRNTCLYLGKDLIRMNFDDFLCLINELPNSHETIYVPVNKNRDQNQQVYDFDKLGLQIWAWRNKIRSVIIDNSNKYESAYISL